MFGQWSLVHKGRVAHLIFARLPTEPLIWHGERLKKTKGAVAGI